MITVSIVLKTHYVRFECSMCTFTEHIWMFHDMCTFMEHQVPREGDVVNWGKDFLVGYHIVDPFHQPDHVPDPRHKIINIIGQW